MNCQLRVFNVITLVVSSLEISISFNKESTILLVCCEKEKREIEIKRNDTIKTGGTFLIIAV
jgi:hypothetical protein